MPAISPVVMKWARETAGLSLDDAARKLGFKDSAKRSAIDRLQAIEEGKGAVSRSVLLAMVRLYRRSLLTFYLTEPPRKGERGQDFRTLPNAPDPMQDALVDALIRDVRARQEMTRSLLDDEDAESIGFVGSMKGSRGVAE